MGNPYFRCKQFEIRQDRCAMKVSTDACLFGAWLASRQIPCTRILDVGTGTGLLTAMMAQGLSATFVGIEIDPDAAGQAHENLQASPWHQRCEVVRGDARLHVFPERFDGIISNPPFYADQLQSPDEKVNLARHGNSLSLSELAETMARNLLPGGYTAVLLPFQRADDWLVTGGSYGWRLVHRLDLRQSPVHAPFRTCILLQDGYLDASEQQSISIREQNGQYSEAAVQLLKPYYLYL